MIDRTINRLEGWLARRAVKWALLVLLAIVYAQGYRMHSLFPGYGEAASGRGWWTWTDQQRYLEEARAIASGRLNPTNYHYPVGYPALGALFVRLMPAHPFFWPNLLLILAAAICWWRLALRWLRRVEALLVAILFIVTHGLLLGNTMVVPWNTIATQAALLAGLWTVLTTTGIRAVVWLAVLGAAAYSVRPIDACAFAPLLIFATCRITTWRGRIVAGLSGLSILAVAVLGVVWLNLVIFGQPRTPYDVVSLETIGFFGYPISYKLYWLLIDGQPLFGEIEPGLLFRYPWLFMGLPAAVFLIQKERAAGIAVGLAAGVNLLLYLNYNDFLPSDIYRFNLIHYIAWAFPFGFLLAGAACRHVRRSRLLQLGFGLAVAGVILGVGLRMTPRRLPLVAAANSVRLPNTRPLLIEFPSAGMASLSELRLDGRNLTEYSEYLVPYLPSHLQLLLGRKSEGAVLTAASGGPLSAPPVLSVYEWNWSLALDRLGIRSKAEAR